jgi:hypothetical protein
MRILEIGMICWDLFKQERKEKKRFEWHRAESGPQTEPYVSCVALDGPRKRPCWARPDWGRLPWAGLK